MERDQFGPFDTNRWDRRPNGALSTNGPEQRYELSASGNGHVLLAISTLDSWYLASNAYEEYAMELATAIIRG